MATDIWYIRAFYFTPNRCWDITTLWHTNICFTITLSHAVGFPRPFLRSKIDFLNASVEKMFLGARDLGSHRGGRHLGKTVGSIHRKMSLFFSTEKGDDDDDDDNGCSCPCSWWCCCCCCCCFCCCCSGWCCCCCVAVVVALAVALSRLFSTCSQYDLGFFRWY